jgi:hypothetical protein
MGRNDNVKAEAVLEITVQGRTFRTSGPITRISNDRPPVEGYGPSGFWELQPGPYETVCVTFKAFDMKREEVTPGAVGKRTKKLTICTCKTCRCKAVAVCRKKKHACCKH